MNLNLYIWWLKLIYFHLFYCQNFILPLSLKYNFKIVHSTKLVFGNTHIISIKFCQIQQNAKRKTTTKIHFVWRCIEACNFGYYLFIYLSQRNKANKGTWLNVCKVKETIGKQDKAILYPVTCLKTDRDFDASSATVRRGFWSLALLSRFIQLRDRFLLSRFVCVKCFLLTFDTIMYALKIPMIKILFILLRLNTGKSECRLSSRRKLYFYILKMCKESKLTNFST